MFVLEHELVHVGAANLAMEPGHGLLGAGVGGVGDSDSDSDDGADGEIAMRVKDKRAEMWGSVPREYRASRSGLLPALHCQARPRPSPAGGCWRDGEGRRAGVQDVGHNGAL